MNTHSHAHTATPDTECSGHALSDDPVCAIVTHYPKLGMVGIRRLRFIPVAGHPQTTGEAA